MIIILAVIILIIFLPIILDRWSKRHLKKLESIKGDCKELTKLSREIHIRALDKGFYSSPQELGTSLMLIVSELSEVLDADRLNHYASLPDFHKKLDEEGDEHFKTLFEKEIKDTVEDELADSLIRILDVAGKLNIDIGTHTELKMRYNQLRPHKNGKKY